MKFLRFGDTVVNMARVNSIIFSPAGRNRPAAANLYYSAPITSNGIDTLMPDYTKLEGPDVIALEQWLEDNCEDAREPMMTEA